MRLRKKIHRIKPRIKNFFSKKILARLDEEGIFLAKLYYFFLDSSFNREMLSVLLGKKVHNSRNENLESNQAFLRRSTHRIEKGLIVPKQKKHYALGYIYDTCRILRVTYKDIDEKSLSWVVDVLDAYFKRADDTLDVIKKSKKEFDAIRSKISIQQEPNIKSIPFEHKELEASKIAFSDYLKLTERRHSVRYFENGLVDKTLIENAVSAGLQSPSACNRQPFEVLVLQDKNVISKAVELPMGVQTFKDEIKNLAIVLGDLSYYSEERDRHIIYIDSGLFVMSFVLGLEAQGLSSCVINWPDIEERENSLYKQFKIPKHKRCICFIAFGYAKSKGLVPFSEKKEASDIVMYNEYSNR
ncbi:nitroreductase family protein [uncultured Winogradskyella sp.]|uniref:nitroreductase family protein n=1 Tax=uncultured Winogradskyella sp. TaxID=395353 RepID=UPI002615AFAF|nr:nitroreductase family protein [uncultured Winogradskyella sp.]